MRSQEHHAFCAAGSTLRNPRISNRSRAARFFNGLGGAEIRCECPQRVEPRRSGARAGRSEGTSIRDLRRDRLIGVDGGPSFVARRSAAVSGKPTFAEAMVNGDVAPIAVGSLTSRAVGGNPPLNTERAADQRRKRHRNCNGFTGTATPKGVRSLVFPPL
jgi:hypothetical protein